MQNTLFPSHIFEAVSFLHTLVHIYSKQTYLCNASALACISYVDMSALPNPGVCTICLFIPHHQNTHTHIQHNIINTLHTKHFSHKRSWHKLFKTSTSFVSPIIPLPLHCCHCKKCEQVQALLELEVAGWLWQGGRQMGRERSGSNREADRQAHRHTMTNLFYFHTPDLIASLWHLL